MSDSLQYRRGVHRAQKQRGIDKGVIERRPVKMRRNAEHRRASNAKLGKFFHAPSIPMESACG